jgi:hypothetical protein
MLLPPSTSLPPLPPLPPQLLDLEYLERYYTTPPPDAPDSSSWWDLEGACSTHPALTRFTSPSLTTRCYSSSALLYKVGLGGAGTGVCWCLWVSVVTGWFGSVVGVGWVWGGYGVSVGWVWGGCQEGWAGVLGVHGSRHTLSGGSL